MPSVSTTEKTDDQNSIVESNTTWNVEKTDDQNSIVESNTTWNDLSWDNTKIVTLAKCLTEKKAIFYGTQRCGHCQNQKALFGDAMSDVTFIDCDAQKDKCAQIKSYPTWIFADGSLLLGTQGLDILAQRAWCVF
jgi:ribosomal protein S27E